MGSGIAGLLHIQLACAMGAGRVIATDIVDSRLKAAKKFGAEATIHAKENLPVRLREVNEGRLADLVIVCTGNTQAIAQGLQAVDRGGTVLIFTPKEPGSTVTVSLSEFFSQNVTLTTSYAGSPADYALALELIKSRRICVEEMITHRLSLAETGLGFKLFTDATESLKVIVEPQK